MGSANGQNIADSMKTCESGCAFTTEKFIPAMRKLLFNHGEEVVVAPEVVFDALEDPGFLNGDFNKEEVSKEPFVQWVKQTEARLKELGRTRLDHPFFLSAWIKKYGSPERIPEPWSTGSTGGLGQEAKDVILTFAPMLPIFNCHN